MKYPQKTIRFISSIFILLIILSSSLVSGQEIDGKTWKAVMKMSHSELNKLYGDQNMLTTVSSIKSTMKIAPDTEPQWEIHQDVDLAQVSFDVIVQYNRITNPDIGEVASYRETLKCVLSKYRSLKWNRLSFYQNECQDCGDVSLIELKKRTYDRYVKKT